MYFVYGLICSDNTLYIGSTNNLQRRLAEHNREMCEWTKTRLPLKLDFYIAVHNENRARKLEQYLKTGSGKAILKKRILSDEAPAGA
ncbi:excinuclease ABC subunit C [Candidatus Uhrbacteria bacterium]|nr:MAG: excinuclease ABC subunit C [Candidatus Uhrbacteria bacterium]